jgi:hypothetical protein
MRCHRWPAIIWNKEAIDEIHFNHSGIGGHDCYVVAGIYPLSGTLVVPMGYLGPARGVASHIRSDDEGRRRVSNLREQKRQKFAQLFNAPVKRRRSNTAARMRN